MALLVFYSDGQPILEMIVPEYLSLLFAEYGLALKLCVAFKSCSCVTMTAILCAYFNPFGDEILQSKLSAIA